jgi:hypothetical protein
MLECLGRPRGERLGIYCAGALKQSLYVRLIR